MTPYAISLLIKHNDRLIAETVSLIEELEKQVPIDFFQITRQKIHAEKLRKENFELREIP